MDRRVRLRQVQPANIKELDIALEEEWDGIPAQVIQNLIRSMSHRCQAVIDSHAAHNPYSLLGALAFKYMQSNMCLQNFFVQHFLAPSIR